MIEETVNEMMATAMKMKEILMLDIEDVKAARHEDLLNRCVTKEELMQTLSDGKVRLNSELAKAYQSGIDINNYREMVNDLEAELVKLYELNTRLGFIVAPIKKLYSDIVEELTLQNGGTLYDVKA